MSRDMILSSNCQTIGNNKMPNEHIEAPLDRIFRPKYEVKDRHVVEEENIQGEIIMCYRQSSAVIRSKNTSLII